MHDDALAHLRTADPRLAAVIDRVGACVFEPQPRDDGTHFGAVARAIVYQQLSGKAAATIHRRFAELYGGRSPTPQELLDTPEETLRSVGLSRQKTAYLKDLAARVAAGEVPIESLDELPDDAIVEALVRVKGVGRWTAQMFLMFRLGRPDVLPDLDLGVQKGLQLAHALDTLPSPRDVTRIGAPWAPYRSIASWYLWRLLDNGGGQAAPTTTAAAAKQGKQGSGARSAADRTAVTTRRPKPKKKPSTKTPSTKRKAATKAVARASAAKKRSGERGAGKATTRATKTSPATKGRRPTQGGRSRR